MRLKFKRHRVKSDREVNHAVFWIGFHGSKTFLFLLILRILIAGWNVFLVLLNYAVFVFSRSCQTGVVVELQRLEVLVGFFVATSKLKFG